MASNRGFLGKEANHRVLETRKGGVALDWWLVILQALAVSLWLPASIAVTLLAAWSGGIVLHWLVLAIFSIATVLYHIIYEQRGPVQVVQVTLNLGMVALAFYSIGRVLSWAVGDVSTWPHWVVVVLWCLVPGLWIGFGMVLLAFGQEVLYRSPAMEEHLWGNMAKWFFDKFLPGTARPRSDRMPIQYSAPLPPSAPDVAAPAQPAVEELSLPEQFLKLVIEHEDELRTPDGTVRLSRDKMTQWRLPDGQKLTPRKWKQAVDFLARPHDPGHGWVMNNGGGWQFKPHVKPEMALRAFTEEEK